MEKRLSKTLPVFTLLAMIAVASNTALAQETPEKKAPEEKNQAVESGVANPEARVALVEFRELPLGTALQVLSHQTGINFAASKEARKVDVSLYLQNTSAKQAIEVLCQVHELWHSEIEPGKVVRIHTVDEYNSDVRSFREDRVETFTLLYPNAEDVATAISNIYGDRVQLGFGTQGALTRQELQQRLNRFDIIDGRRQGFGDTGTGTGGTNSNNNNNFGGRNNFNNGGLNNGFGGGGLGGFGGGLGGLGGGLGGFGGGFGRNQFGRGNSVNGRGQNQNIDLSNQRIEGLTAQDIQNLQRGQNSETLNRILNQTTIYVTVLQRLNKLIVRTSDERTMEQIRKLVKSLDIPTPMVLLEVKIMAVELSDGFNSVFDYQFADGSTSAGGFTTGDVLGPASDSVRGDALRRMSSLALQGTGLNTDNLIFQFVDSHFRARVQLLENQNRVTTLATPLLLTANAEVSQIFVGEERPLNRSFVGPQTLVNAAGGQATTPGTTNIEFRNIGTTLLVTPNINADDTVTLRLVQENSQINQNGANILVPTDTGFQQQSIDTVQTRAFSGTVIAKDGLAVAVGGLIEEGVNDNRSGVPWLGRLPVLGFFFRRQQKGRFRRELVILIRPFVIRSPKQGQDLSQAKLEELSLHPNAPEMKGVLGTYGEDEVLRPAPPVKGLKKLFRFHNVEFED